MTADDDYKLLSVGIGFTNMVERATKGSADLTRKEIKRGKGKEEQLGSRRVKKVQRVKKRQRYLWYLNPGPQCENGFWHRFFP